MTACTTCTSSSKSRPLDLAQALVDGGRSYWASGISLFRADVLVEEYRRYDPPTALWSKPPSPAPRAAPPRARATTCCWTRPPSSWPATNHERAVFEVSDRIALAPLHGIEWDDVGAWSAVHRISDRNEANNLLLRRCHRHRHRNSLIQAEGRLVAVIGMENVVVVDTPDALLVTHRGRAQDVKALVERLQAEKPGRGAQPRRPRHLLGPGRGAVPRAGL